MVVIALCVALLANDPSQHPSLMYIENFQCLGLNLVLGSCDWPGARKECWQIRFFRLYCRRKKYCNWHTNIFAPPPPRPPPISMLVNGSLGSVFGNYVYYFFVFRHPLPSMHASVFIDIVNRIGGELPDCKCNDNSESTPKIEFWNVFHGFLESSHNRMTVTLGSVFGNYVSD